MASTALLLFAVFVSPSLAESAARAEDICIAPSEGSVDSPASAGHVLLQSKQELGSIADKPKKTFPKDWSNKPIGKLGSEEDKKIGEVEKVPKDWEVLPETFFYHVHVPRTAGTSVATLLVANVCQPPGSQPAVRTHLSWAQRCTHLGGTGGAQKCKIGLTDNAFACYPGRTEHALLSQSLQRGEHLKEETGAKRIVYVTTLRSGSDRVRSQWLFEVGKGSWVPPPGIPKISNASLQAYVTGAASAGPGNNVQLARQRGNIQVSYLASVFNHGQPHIVNRHDLEVAKKALTTGEWLIGFSMCMSKLDKKLMEMHDREYSQRDLPHISQSPGAMFPKVSEVQNVIINQQTKEILNEQCKFDNELYNWAWNEAKKGKDSRFTETC